MERKTIELRAHTERPVKENSKTDDDLFRIVPDKWPKRALVLDCETLLDQTQGLIFGCYYYCREEKGVYQTAQDGLFYADDLDSEQVAIIETYGKAHHTEVLTRSEFIKCIFWQAVRAEALIDGFNLAFDLSRLALEGCWTTRRGGAWSLTMDQYRDPEIRKMRENKFRPRLTIKPKDGKGCFFRLVNSRNQNGTEFPPVRCLDLKTLFWALYNKSHTLDSACRALGIPGKIEGHKPTGKVSVEEIEYNRQDGIATVGLLNALKREFDRHPIMLNPDRAFSPASIAKAYLEQTGLALPSEKFDVSPQMNGIAMQGYYGGRVESRIRNTAVPVVYVDFMSQYPTVNSLMGLWRFLTAEQLIAVDATKEASELLKTLTLEKTLSPKLWERLPFFALIQPSEDIVPVRTRYNEKNSNIGVDPLTSNKPIWYAGPDIVASVLLTGKVPQILKAVRVIPKGTQAGLKPIALRGAIDIDPMSQDFFRAVIESRARMKFDTTITESERKALMYFLKILANAGSYGLFVELNPERIKNKSKTNREKIHIYSGGDDFETSSEIVENPGPWYCPIFASLITSAGRLLLAMLERSITDRKGSYAMCDTDSMAIVASEKGGLVPCAGGAHRLPDGREAVNALSWADVDHVSEQFEQIKPYDPNMVRTRILKIEDVNSDSKGQRQLFCYSISSKRYALFIKTADGIEIVKASGHGLGYLYAPKAGFDEERDAPFWIVESWDWIIRKALNLPCVEPAWFDSPAMMRIVIRTPEVLKVLQERQRYLPYRERTKCFNFISSPLILKPLGYPADADPNRFFLVAPLAPDSTDWYEIDWVNVYDGKPYRLARPENEKQSNEALTHTYRSILLQYTKHVEAKSLSPDGKPCSSSTAGLLRRVPIIAADEFRIIGKETNRRWEEEEDISLFNSRVVEYRPKETKRMISDPILRNEMLEIPFSEREWADVTDLSRNTIHAALKGKQIRKATALRLSKAANFINAFPLGDS
jgi:hypothetical protein